MSLWNRNIDNILFQKPQSSFLLFSFSKLPRIELISNDINLGNGWILAIFLCKFLTCLAVLSKRNLTLPVFCQYLVVNFWPFGRHYLPEAFLLLNRAKKKKLYFRFLFIVVEEIMIENFLLLIQFSRRNIVFIFVSWSAQTLLRTKNKELKKK